MHKALLIPALTMAATLSLMPIGASALQFTPPPSGSGTPPTGTATTGTGTTTGTTTGTGGTTATPTATGLPGIPGTANSLPVPGCTSVRGKSLYDSYTVKVSDIEKCINEGYDPPVEWRPGYGFRAAAGGGSSAVTFAGKCPVDGKCPSATGSANPLPNAAPVPTQNPALNLPPMNVPTTGKTPPLPCGGAAALNLTQIINTGLSIGNNVRIGNVSGAVSTGINLARSFLSPCSGGWQSLIGNALNVILPAVPGGAAILNGNMPAPSGTILMLPPGMTIDMGVGGGQIKLPDGGTFTDLQGLTITIPAGGGIISYTGNTVTLMDGSTVTVGSGNVTIKPGPGGMGGGVILPDGITLPIDTGIPINTPTSSPNSTPPVVTPPTIVPQN